MRYTRTKENFKVSVTNVEQQGCFVTASKIKNKML